MISFDNRSKFISFLDERGLYQQFIDNLRDVSSTNLFNFFESWNDPNSIVQHAFAWISTPEGFEFWERQDTMWKASFQADHGKTQSNHHHVWKRYDGFREVYEYCSLCDEKRERA